MKYSDISLQVEWSQAKGIPENLKAAFQSDYLKGIIDSGHICLGSNKSCLGESQRQKALLGYEIPLWGF